MRRAFGAPFKYLYVMNEQLFSGIKTGLGIVGGIANNIAAHKQQKRAIQFQREENEKARRYNKEMAEYQNLVARENTMSERLYNSPASVMQRLKSAGINPDLAFASDGASFANASAASAASVSPVAPAELGSIIGNTQLPMESILQSVTALKTMAETSKIRADVKKTKGEITSLDLDNIRKAATNGKMIELDNFQIDLAKSTLNLNEAQLTNLRQNLENMKTQNDMMNSQIDEIVAHTRNLDSSTLVNRVSAYLETKKFDNDCRRLVQELKESDARINLSNAQAKEILLLVMAKKLNLDSQTFLNHAKTSESYTQNENLKIEGNNLKLFGTNLDITGKSLQFTYEQATKYDDAMKATQIISNVIGAASATVMQMYMGQRVMKGMPSSY